MVLSGKTKTLTLCCHEGVHMRPLTGNVTERYSLNSQNERQANGLQTNGKPMFQPFKTGLSTIRLAREKFWTDAINIWTALEKFWMGDACHSNGDDAILNRWHKLFEWLTKKFRMDETSHSNG